jgi:hypothetical protein
MVDLFALSKINERITINGKLGVPFGGINVSLQLWEMLKCFYRVNEDGTLNLRHNKENDINYIGQGIGYTKV